MKAIPPFRGQKIPLSQRLISGAIGQDYVIKHYRKAKRVVKTKFPNMTGIIPSAKQKVSRHTFRKAVAFAQSIYRNSEKKREWQRKLRKPRRLFQALMKVYYKQKAERLFQNQIRLNRWRKNITQNSSLPQWQTPTILFALNQPVNCNLFSVVYSLRSSAISAGLPIRHPKIRHQPFLLFS
jgi:hypothetical protein